MPRSDRKDSRRRLTEELTLSGFNKEEADEKVRKWFSSDNLTSLDVTFVHKLIFEVRQRTEEKAQKALYLRERAVADSTRDAELQKIQQEAERTIRQVFFLLKEFLGSLDKGSSKILVSNHTRLAKLSALLDDDDLNDQDSP